MRGAGGRALLLPSSLASGSGRERDERRGLTMENRIVGDLSWSYVRDVSMEAMMSLRMDWRRGKTGSDAMDVMERPRRGCRRVASGSCEDGREGVREVVDLA